MPAVECIPVDCEHAGPGIGTRHVSCALGLYGGTPHTLICNACRRRSPKMLPGRDAISPAVVARERQDKVALPVEALATAVRRANVCRSCLYNRGVHLGNSETTSYTVNCRRAAEGTVSLIKGTCRADRWTLCDSDYVVRELGGSRGVSPTFARVRLRDYFGAVYVISLARTPERLTQFWDGFPKDWPFKRPTVFEAIDADREWAWEGWNGGGGAYGCWRSWMAILSMYLAELPKLPLAKRRPLLVMEDDCEFIPDAVTRMSQLIARLPDDWEIAFPGGQHFQPTDPVAEGVVRCRETGRTHCVMINPRFVADLYSFWLRWDTHIDHGLQYWCKTEPQRCFYAADPFLAIQRANWSTIRWCQEPSRSWDGRVTIPKRNKSDVSIVLLRVTQSQLQSLRNKGMMHTGYWRDQRGVDRGLIELMKKPEDLRPDAMETWIALLRAEAAAFPKAEVGIWWPDDPTAMRDLLTLIGVPFTERSEA
jgi:hypothetical protein